MERLKRFLRAWIGRLGAALSTGLLRHRTGSGMITAGLILAHGFFTMTAYNPDGSMAWQEPLWFKNGATTVGLNNMLNTHFDNTTAKLGTWYMGLINNSSFSALSSADTMGSHAGWIESTDYSESTRPQWSPSAASGGSITNSGTVDFTINGTVTIRGGFIVSNSTKGGTSGLLFATGQLSSPQSLVSSQVLKLTYTCPLTPT